MKLADLLGISPGITAVTGSGGKTALLRALGGELAAAGNRVLLCTTTHILPFEGLPCLLSPTEAALGQALEESRLVCTGTAEAESGKLTAPGIPMARLAAAADYVLAEADGSARRPLKAHAPWEPAIPPESGRTVCILGLTGLGRPIREAAHRPELYARLAGAGQDEPATAACAARVLAAESPADVYFFNQADTPELLAAGRALARLLDRPAVVGSLLKGEYFLC